MPVVRKRAPARHDLIEYFDHPEEHAGLATAERFLDQAAASPIWPGSSGWAGGPLHLTHPDLVSLRKWRIKGFDNHLIFYVPIADGVSIVRVLHAASDWWSLLGVDPD
jgi:toxin ParE1/3/4